MDVGIQPPTKTHTTYNRFARYLFVFALRACRVFRGSARINKASTKTAIRTRVQPYSGVVRQGPYGERLRRSYCDVASCTVHPQRVFEKLQSLSYRFLATSRTTIGEWRNYTKDVSMFLLRCVSLLRPFGWPVRVVGGDVSSPRYILLIVLTKRRLVGLRHFKICKNNHIFYTYCNTIHVHSE